MTKYKIVDNSGGIEAKLIKVLHKQKGNIGDIIVVSIQKIMQDKKVKRGTIHKAIIIRTRKVMIRPDGTQIRFGENGIILLDPNLNPLGTRIQGPLPLEIHKYKKVASLGKKYV